MNNVISEMLNQYNINTTDDKKNSLKEVLQEVTLCALSKTDFFDYAAFYGGTALRIFYNLDRFSEDLDFSLKATDENFNSKKYLNAIENEINSYGLKIVIEEKIKNIDTSIKSAFLKGDTHKHLLCFYEEENFNNCKGEVFKIKIELDTAPPDHANFEVKYRLLPQPYRILLYDKSSLFAGKIHAVLCRNWKNRIKGRDLYDYVYYLSLNTPLNIKHLEARLKQSNVLNDTDTLTLSDLKKLLKDKFSQIDFEQAKNDVERFLINTNKLDLWCEDFFVDITNQLIINQY